MTVFTTGRPILPRGTAATSASNGSSRGSNYHQLQQGNGYGSHAEASRGSQSTSQTTGPRLQPVQTSVPRLQPRTGSRTYGAGTAPTAGALPESTGSRMLGAGMAPHGGALPTGGAVTQQHQSQPQQQQQRQAPQPQQPQLQTMQQVSFEPPSPLGKVIESSEWIGSPSEMYNAAPAPATAATPTAAPAPAVHIEVHKTSAAAAWQKRKLQMQHQQNQDELTATTVTATALSAEPANRSMLSAATTIAPPVPKYSSMAESEAARTRYDMASFTGMLRSRFVKNQACSYMSKSLGRRIPATIVEVDPSTGAVQVDVKQGHWIFVEEQAEILKPRKGLRWAKGQACTYMSKRQGRVIPTKVVDVNEVGEVMIEVKPGYWMKTAEQRELLNVEEETEVLR
eukprot:gnl/TRDRNA2_/TRDRNA2_136151_c0_seq1.p1 gnl/TRDRNA2_/TRDRNA2_136151_c0~~gnl/TRDRNA2_/TRDRNA2_136151_c0_seq1.p1  ORF type:complete len:397 (+),score=65.66 gnl/TRDRNA2_/TRDRNA2_136151_c0_seq1:91-1281(+)